MCMCIYIYIERERERGIKRHASSYKVEGGKRYRLKNHERLQYSEQLYLLHVCCAVLSHVQLFAASSHVFKDNL